MGNPIDCRAMREYYCFFEFCRVKSPSVCGFPFKKHARQKQRRKRLREPRKTLKIHSARTIKLVWVCVLFLPVCSGPNIPFLCPPPSSTQCLFFHHRVSLLTPLFPFGSFLLKQTNRKLPFVFSRLVRFSSSRQILLLSPFFVVFFFFLV